MSTTYERRSRHLADRQPTRVPRLLCIIDYETCEARSVDPVAVAALCANAGASILARAKTIPSAARDAFFHECVRFANYSGVLCVISGEAELAERLGAHGAHLSANQPPVTDRAASLLIGRSTHSIDELEQAAAEGCDYAFLSPIYASNSKVGLEGRGLAFLRSATRVATLPVLALGGILPDRVESVRKAGAYGVAALGPFASREAGKHARMFLSEARRAGEATRN